LDKTWLDSDVGSLILSDSTSHFVSVIVPAKNEAKNIGSLIPEIRQSLYEYDNEIILVDDGSDDGTSKVAHTNDTIVVSHEKNLGKGAAMKTGVKNARGDLFVFIDADGAHDPWDIPAIIAPILEGKADLVIGSRILPDSKVDVSPLFRRLSNSLASFVISFVISFLLPLATLLKCPVKYIRITDCTSGFRAIRKDVWQQLDLRSRGFEAETEMIYEAARNRFVISEVPITCNWDSQFSHLSIWGDGLRTLVLLLKKLIGDLGKGQGRHA